MNELSPAEQAAAEALAAAIRQTTGMQVLALGCADMARPVVAAVEPHHTLAAFEQAAADLDQLAALNARETRGTPEGPWIVAGLQRAALAIRKQVRALRADLEGNTDR